MASDACRLCGGVGWVIESADGRKQAHPCVCRGATIARARLDAAGIPQRYRDCTLENFSDNHVSLTRARSAAGTGAAGLASSRARSWLAAIVYARQRSHFSR